MEVGSGPSLNQEIYGVHIVHTQTQSQLFWLSMEMGGAEVFAQMEREVNSDLEGEGHVC